MRAKIVADYKSLGWHCFCGHIVILGRRRNKWQDTDYILRLFGDKESTARRNYSKFVRKGVDRGRRPDLIGGGLLRSHGGWAALKSLRKSGDYQKGDERILGDGEFVTEVLAQAEEQFQHKYRIRSEGYDMEKLIGRVAEVTQLSPKKILDTERDRKRTQARSILCFWATDQLGITQTELSRMLKLTQSAVSHAVRRGRILVERSSHSIFDD